uniref:Engulfment and cell motility, putative (inferred by orthology to a S. mansoni protein) n=1 Tax=Anisakis simplex TaxID=6269 RepID=A0A0M3K3P8_ANISI
LSDNMSIDDKPSIKMKEKLRGVLSQIRGYRELCTLVEARRLEKYDKENMHHEKRLIRLWDLLMPNEKLKNRKTKQWQKIGFQSDDPSTDFRGMGILSLEQLLFFAQYDFDEASSVLSLSMDTKYEFPMAIAGITFSWMLRDLLHRGYLKTHFYNSVAGAPSLNNFHRIYCKLFKLFSKYWKYREPSSMMDFNSVKDDFEQRFIEKITSEDVNILKIEFDDLIS